MCSATS